jgi:hypothetical protein
MQARQRGARSPEPGRAEGALQVAEQLLVGSYRARVANKRWLLVTTPV